MMTSPYARPQKISHENRMAIGANEVLLLPILLICSAFSIAVPYRFAFIGPLVVVFIVVFLLDLRRPSPKKVPGSNIKKET